MAKLSVLVQQVENGYKITDSDILWKEGTRYRDQTREWVARSTEELGKLMVKLAHEANGVGNEKQEPQQTSFET